jgi:4-hydroxy-3-polyprenylbenzoate decarboxylase
MDSAIKARVDERWESLGIGIPLPPARSGSSG